MNKIYADTMRVYVEKSDICDTRLDDSISLSFPRGKDAREWCVDNTMSG